LVPFQVPPLVVPLASILEPFQALLLLPIQSAQLVLFKEPQLVVYQPLPKPQSQEALLMTFLELVSILALVQMLRAPPALIHNQCPQAQPLLFHQLLKPTLP
jgi:hypothetical protein